MNRKLKALAISLLLAATAALAAPQASQSPALPTPATQPDPTTTQTIIIFRHGEKPAGGLGQLNPQGFNRALALSTLLPQKFGKPDYLFAPDPHQKVTDVDQLYYYLRPLATIEPTAIRLNMPVQTPCGYRDTDELIDELSKPQYARATIFIAWEHLYARTLAADLFKKFGGQASQVPAWPGQDFDSLYIVTIRRAPGQSPAASFTHDHEGLDGQSTQMPDPAPK